MIGGWSDHLALCDVKRDEDGYTAAVKLLDVVYQNGKDTIAIGTPVEVWLL